MIDFVEYVISELKSKKLSRENAISLIRHFSLESASPTTSSVIHPLLHTNISDIYQQCYRSSFSGDEFFLSDHRILTSESDLIGIIPGVAYLEIARAAVVDAIPELSDMDQVQLNDIVWITPIYVANRKNIFVSLSSSGSEQTNDIEIKFEVFTADAEQEGSEDEVLHCRGIATLITRDIPKKIHIDLLKARMSKGQLDANSVYSTYLESGIKFGPAHQAVKRIFCGDEEAVAHLALPSAISHTLNEYRMHPSLMDGALQAAIGLVSDLRSLKNQLSLPFALDSLRLHSGCKQEMYAWIRHSKTTRPDDKIVKLDIELCDAEGNVCVQLRGFSSRTLGPSANPSTLPAPADSGIVLASPVWKPVEIQEVNPTDVDQYHILLYGLTHKTAERLRALIPTDYIHEISAQSSNIAGRFIDAALNCFELIRSFIEKKIQGRIFVQIVIPDEADSKLLAGLSGLLKSATLEYPDIQGQILLLDKRATSDELAAHLQSAYGQTKDTLIRYSAGDLQTLAWQELSADFEFLPIPFKEGGVYLITGGLGGLGTLFAKEILRQTTNVKLILTGRGKLSVRVEQKLVALANENAYEHKLEYWPLDLSNPAEVERMVIGIGEKHGPLKGIIHSAGMVADHFIAKKTSEEFLEVLEPKVIATVNLDLATRCLDLDFLVLFSSGASITGNVGQSDYAVANGFLDHFADYRNRLVESGKRRGKTLSINWPLWHEGGMRMSPQHQDFMRELTGMHAMQTRNGMLAFYWSLRSQQQQVVVIEGDLKKIRRTLFDQHQETTKHIASDPSPSVDVIAEWRPEELFQQTQNYLRRQFAGLLKLPYDRVDASAPLEKYGMDSILAMDLTNQLEKTFGPLKKTLFFEYQTISELTTYFLNSHASKLDELFEIPQQSQRDSVKKLDETPVQVALKMAHTGKRRQTQPRYVPAIPSLAESNRHGESIAIIGLSGRYPEAPDTEVFWQNLRDGKDCIIEIPEERWDWREYYSEDRTAEGCHFSRWGGFITGVDEFDPLFFNIPPVDAELIDPQERLFLQHAWMAVEDAGYTRAGLQRIPREGQADQAGVYVGLMYGEYQLFGAESSLQGKRIGIPVSYASIANRVSYIFNLHGPSMTLDTMCSSSLTAIHLACQDLKQGRTHLAIAGGVNVTIHPNKYLILSAGQYISSDGHCQSFGEGGDGYIPGEGVGAVVLKRLSEAEKDGNHIYGVIKGSALNHGGKTNGYSVPNPRAQASVIKQALQESDTDARHISYVEAHGTGTKLGDPIEIAALTEVFREYTQERQFCAIGSTKSNIGHCESAAGIAGLTKVLLQMKHRRIVPSLHSSVLNPHIDFAESPFVVNQTLREWEQPQIDGKPVPRIAGISSFGAGGSNAHLVVEEYAATRADRSPDVPEAPNGQVIILLSARTADQLEQKVRDLLAFISRQEQVIHLRSMAYTLQVGREAMDVRLAFVVDSITRLVDKLESYTRDEEGVEHCFYGQIDKDMDSISLLNQDDDMTDAIDKWIARGKLTKLASLWVKGLEIDWRKLYSDGIPSLLSLPTYPFAKDRYWITPAIDRNTNSGRGTPVLHPLLHTNTSDFFQQSYASEFTGEERFLADHQIGAEVDNRQRLLPGVAYLEMVRAAVDLALPAHRASRQMEIRNVAWVHPLTVNDSKRVSVVLSANGESIVDFEVQSTPTDGQDALVHCQGQVEVVSAARPHPLDPQALEARMTRGAMAPKELYAAFEAMGIHYGPWFRRIVALYKGQDQVLAELAPAGGSDPDQGAYALHPGLLDSALQAAIGLVADLDALPDEPSVPFALDSIIVLSPCPSHMFALISYADGERPENGIRKIDIDLCDQDGHLCARLRGLASRTLHVEADQDNAGILIARPYWEPISSAGDASTQMIADGNHQADRRHQIVLFDLPHLDADRMATLIPGFEAEWLPLAGTENLAERYRSAALACFTRLQTILKQAPRKQTLFQCVIGHQGNDTLLAGLSGLMDTARLENPNLVAQVILTEQDIDEQALANQLRVAQARSGDSLFNYAHSVQSRLCWRSEEIQEASRIAFKNRGVYLITGGLGGLGLLFAREILGGIRGAVVVLTGRSDLDAEKRSALDGVSADLSIPADRLLYRKLDLNSLEQVEALVAGIVKEFGGLHGVIHSAGMIRDNFIINKSPAEFLQVLEPKVVGTVNLDLATQHTDLDFIVLFSSVASALGNAGQADYAAANGFMDQFAAYRNRLVDAARRRGKTLSINWPLWQEGGMQLDAETRELLTKTSGMQPMKTASGMQALHFSLALDAGQVLVLEGHVGRLRRSLQDRHTPIVVERPSASEGIANSDKARLQEKTQRYLINQFSSLLKIPSHEVSAQAPLEKYGMDSVLAMKLTSALEHTFGSLSKTLFFEYQTIASLAGYLIEAFPEIVQEKAGVRVDEDQRQEPPPEAPIRSGLLPSIRNKGRFVESPHRGRSDIAIIGLSGRYPLAENLDEFWENLKSGRDCISEIPQERWDHTQFFHPERNQPGKTYSKWGGFISGVDQFDALFFSISPKEAELMDPQERLFMETAWETIEDAGYSKDAISRLRVGVFVGVMWGQYELYGTPSTGSGIPSSSFSSIANRVSYFFDFHGPSLALDTMCSSSLTAIHLASEEVRQGTIDVAIAGGVNASIHPNKYLSLSQGNFASTDGRCRSFGAGGDGYVPGEGVGAVLLKPLEKALSDGDQIYAVVKASTINHGGKTNGYTVPNPIAQSNLIRESLDKARIDPGTIDYIETHGTGTSLGDPIEITALAKAFEGSSQQDEPRGKQFCSIGSVKSNIGHLESAAGIAAVTKVLLQLKHQQLVPSLHAEHLNPHIDFKNSPFYVQRLLEDWKPPKGHPRRVGISSFGAGGSNAHLILEEFVDTRESVHPQNRPEAFVLSARTRESLLAYAERMIEFLEQNPAASLMDVAFTSQVGRTPMQERLLVIAPTTARLKDKLQQWLHTSLALDAQAPNSADLGIEDVYVGSTRDAQSSAGAALIEGDAGAAFLQLTLEKRDLAKLAKLWISGVEIDWTSLYRTEHPRRVSMPKYPFVRERYWIETRVPTAPTRTQEEREQMLYYRSEWRPTPPVDTQENHGLNGPLLFLGADDPLFAQFERQSDNAVVVAVKYADGYRSLGQNLYCIDHRSEQDFAKLIEDLQAQDAMPGTIVQLVEDAGAIRQQLDQSLFALHFACQAVLEQKPKRSVQILCVQKHEPAAEYAALYPAIAGYLKSLTLENPKISWKLVSVRGDPAAVDIARDLSDELRDPGWQDSEIRYLYECKGDSTILHRQVKEVKHYRPRAVEPTKVPVKHKGVFIVTGGLGGLGYIFSEYLTKHYGARLVLTGRSALDEERRRKLASLQSNGSELIYVQADVADWDQAHALVRAAKRRFSNISGVIHSAGIHRDAFVLNKTRDEMESVLSAKVMGTINLDRATQDEDLDLFILFSSVAGSFGNPGQCDYAFANSFLDAFAERRQALVASRERSGRSLSINWPFWEQGGMRISQSDIDLAQRRTGISPLPTEKGIQYWETFLQADTTQAIALYGNPGQIDAFLSRSISEKAPPALSSTPKADARLLREATEQYLKILLSEQIKLPSDRIDVQEGFESFGVDSMMVSRINAELARDLGDLPKTLFYEYATIEELAAYLLQEARPALVRHLAIAAPAAIAAKEVPAPAISVESASIQGPSADTEQIAIIGIHGYFPHSESLTAYWRNLRAGRDLIDLVPENRWDFNEFFDADPDNAEHGKIYCKWGGFLDDFDKFDASFFKIAPADARLIDPQERLFVQSVWAALEDAGYTRESLKQRYPKDNSADVGVFVGVTTNSYHLLAPQEWNRGNMVTPGAMPWSIANRVSYFFDFKGPSMPIDTACSSSLAAIHLACMSLQEQECQVAVAGGVNLYLHPAKYQSLCRGRMLAVNGKCRSFGDGDDGFIPGEGVGTVVLKPLAKAIEDRDHIYAVVAASACEHGGSSNGYSAPNPNSQALLIEQTMNKACIDPESIGYVEGHGTGTQLGDNLEVVALTRAFRKGTQQKHYCSLGSVKANIGHLESAAGIAGVAKVLLQLEHREIAPSIHSETINPDIDFENSPFYLQHELSPWKAAAGHPRRAMINSFGAGGVNSCLILEEYEWPEGYQGSTVQGAYLIVLSAQNEQRLEEVATRLRDHLIADETIDLGRLAYTLQVGREAMDARLAIVVSSTDVLVKELSAYADDAPSSQLVLGHVEPHRRRKSPKHDERALAKAMFSRGELDSLALLWVQGQSIEWNDFYGADHPYRLPLPTYPFAKERYWAADSPMTEKRMAVAEPKGAKLHPLVAGNVSTLKETCFLSLLAGGEYYGRDHKIKGESIFPGAGFLEIAYINGTIAGEESLLRLEDIVWIQPLRLAADVHLVKTFLKSNGNNAEYIIVSFDDDNERVVHAEGRVIYGTESTGSSESTVTYSIQELKSRAERTVRGSDCYRQLEGYGFGYGLCFQTIQELYVGSGFVLSRLALADEMKDDFDQYILHPCLIDGALQTVIGMVVDEQTDMPYLPFALDAVEVLRPLSETCYAYVEHSLSEHSVPSEVKSLNILLLNENGDVLVRLDNFYVRALHGVTAIQHDDFDGLLLQE